jgi:hypothetical protein
MPDAIHRDPGDEPPSGRQRRRSRQGTPRTESVRVCLSRAEHAEVAVAASRAGLAQGAYAAEAVLAAARGVMITPDAVLRDILSRLDRAIIQVRRVGVNLNQAVAALHATGRPGGDLVPCAALAVRAAGRLDTAAEELRTRIGPVLRPRGPVRSLAAPRPDRWSGVPDRRGSRPRSADR